MTNDKFPMTNESLNPKSEYRPAPELKESSGVPQSGKIPNKFQFSKFQTAGLEHWGFPA
jgi:hypothetical protein